MTLLPTDDGATRAPVPKAGPRGIGWRALVVERGALAVELWGLPGAWFTIGWHGGFPLGRPDAVFRSPASALAGADGWLDRAAA